MTGEERFIALLKKAVDDREPNSVVRRTDFNYLDGHGTFYKFKEEFPPVDLLDAKRGDRVKLVMYNIHTNRLDEVIFDLTSRFENGEIYVRYLGYISDIDDCFEIQIDYNKNHPYDSRILVFASGRPDINYIKSFFENHQS